MKEKTPIEIVQKQIRETRKEMRDKGIKRRSCFNGGHSSESYRLNNLMFQLELELGRLKGDIH